MAAERDPAVEAFIRDGKQAYAAKRFKNALECFTRAMKRCPCSKGMKRERCGCKRYEEVAAEGNSVFNEAKYTCKCSVSKSFGPCSNSLHVQALDYRAATFEALKELDRARRDAEWMLELFPDLPDGYLRLGKIARLQKKNEFAWKVFNAGIDACAVSNVPTSDPKVEKLYKARSPLHARYFRQDPLALPLDIVHTIFSHIDFLTKLRCLRVCKIWRRALTSPENRHMWRTLVLTKPIRNNRPPTSHSLAKLVGYSGNDVRQLHVKSAYGARIDNAKLRTLLRGSPRLETLEFSNEYEPMKIPAGAWPSTVTSLSLVSARPCSSLWESVSDRLISLNIERYPDLPPSLPNLRYLRMGGLAMNTADLRQCVPKLEQIWYITLEADSLPPEPPVWEHWKELKVIIFDALADISRPYATALIELIRVNRGQNLRHLEVNLSCNLLAGGEILLHNQICFHNESTADHHIPNSFANLRSLRLEAMALPGSYAERMLSTSLADGKLRHIDITCRRPTISEAEGPASCETIREYSWLRGATSIRSIGLSQFRFRRYPTSDEELPLPSFLATFPNLETLEIASEYYEDAEFCSVVVAIIKATKLRRIYQTSVKGAALDILRDVAHGSGVELIWGKLPREWPVPLED